MRYYYDRFYEYGGRTFATIAAAKGAKKMKDWFSNPQTMKNNMAQIFKYPQSRTKTKTKSGEEDSFLNEMQETTGRKVVSVNLGHKPLKRVQKNTIQYRDQFQMEMSWLSNQQYFQQIYSIGTRDQWLTSSGTGQVQRANYFYSNAFQLNPNMYNTGSTAATNGFSDNAWMGMSTATVYMDFLNNTNLPCFAKVHWFKAKTSLLTTPIGDYNSSVVDNDIYILNNTVPATNIVGVGLTSGNEEVLDILSPTTSVYATMTTLPYTNITGRKDVRADWQHLKTSSFTLGAGSSYRLTANHGLNLFQSKTRIDDDLLFPKGCLTAIVEFQGASSHGVGPESTVPGSLYPAFDGPTLAPGKVSCVITRKVNLKTLKTPNEAYDLKYVGAGNVLNNVPVAKASIIGDSSLIADIGRSLA